MQNSMKQEKNAISSNTTRKQSIGKRKGFVVPKWAIIIPIIWTLLIYLRALPNNFTLLDDDFYILKNPFIRDFSFHGVAAIFTSFYNGNYHPLTTLIYLIEYRMVGLNPMFYIVVNILLHLVNVFLVFNLLKKITSNDLLSIVVAFLFAINPLHVESVAWISELKDVLYSCFYLLSIYFYIRWVESGFKTRQYLLMLLFFLASLLSKSAAVTLPVLLLAIDLYKGRKVNQKTIVEKLPLFVLSIVFGIVAILSQRTAGALNDYTFLYGYINRIFLLTYAISFYLIDLFIPISLSAMHFFPKPTDDFLPFEYYVSFPFIGFIIYLLLRKSPIRKQMLFGFFFFLITMSVMLQIISVGSCITAERYSYISSIGLFLMAYHLLDFIIKKNRKIIFIILFSLTTLVYSAQTLDRIAVWNNSEVLFNDVIEKYPDVYLIYWMRGNYEKSIGNMQKAYEDYNKTINLNSIYEDAYYNRGVILDQSGDPKSAITDYNQAIKLKPDYPEAYNNRGWANFEVHDSVAAMADFNKAIKLKPDYFEAYNNRGWAYLTAGNFDSALMDFNKTISLNDDFLRARYNRAALYASHGKYEEAVADYNYLIQKNPKDAGAYYLRGQTYFNLKDNQKACKDWQKSVELGNPQAEQALKDNCK